MSKKILQAKQFGERPKGGFTDKELTKLSPEGQEFIRFCRDLTKRLQAAEARQGTWVGCSVDHGEYAGKDPDNQ